MNPNFTPHINEMIDLLAARYASRDEAAALLRRAGLQVARYGMQGNGMDMWTNVVHEAVNRDELAAILGRAKAEYPNKAEELDDLERGWLARPAVPKRAAMGPALDDSPAAALSAETLEKVMGAQPTFLPIHFLEQGMVCARAVAKIRSPLGVGTGFLIRKDLLLTNNHVIGSAEQAKNSTAWFNFQKSAGGTPQEADE